MGTGYVLDFSNRTFEEFVLDRTGKEIYSDQYDGCGESKANRLRCFWQREPNRIVGRLLAGLVQYCDTISQSRAPEKRNEVVTIATRLQSGPTVADLDSLTAESAGREFEVLATAVRQALEGDSPQTGLDRLHTFAVKYLRLVCEGRGIATPKDKPLHSLMGEYVKALRVAGAIESVMTERILKSSISTLEAFNTVRNEESLAHDNNVLNYAESLLIFNNVASCVRFIQSLENGPAKGSPERDA